MRSLFDRGPNDNYMPPSIIKPVRGLAVPSGGGAVIERTMLNRESRQSGTMRGAGGMGFINRGSSLGTGIDYGTFSGRGAGGARFYGEGVVHLKGGGGGNLTCPFRVKKVNFDNQIRLTVGPGTLNGLLAANYTSCLSAQSTPLVGANGSVSYVVLQVDTDGKQVTSYTIKSTNQLPAAPTPTTPLAPTSFEYPLAVMQGSGIIYSLNPCTQLNAYVHESVRVAKTIQSAADNAYDVYYYWVVR